MAGSLRAMYAAKCDALQCKKNSALLRDLPDVPGAQDDLRELDLGANFLGPKGLLPVLEVVRECRNLTTLSLRDNQLTNQSVLDLCDVALYHPSLRSLDLSHNPITLSAGKALLDLVTTNPRITHVGLEHTNVRPAVAKSVLDRCCRNGAPVLGAPIPFLGRPAAPAAAPATGSPASAVLDAATVLQLLGAVPHSVSPLLFDIDPLDSLRVLCEQNRVKFEDPQFPPLPESVSPNRAVAYGVDRWRRLTDVFPEAALFAVGRDAGEADLVMGAMNASPLVAAAAAVFRASPLSNPLAETFNPPRVSPHGVYSVKLHVNGKWRYVLVDDFVPCVAGEPAFLQLAEGGGLWPLLLEKALAKLHRAYEALDADAAAQASAAVPYPLSPAVLMADLTGGVAMTRDLHHAEFEADPWWDTLREAMAHQGCLCVATSAALPEGEGHGLAGGSSYALLAAQAVGALRLVQLAGPWMPWVRWSGDWAAGSLLWAENDDVAQALGVPESGGPAFWLSYPDFLQLFTSVGLCRPFAKRATVLEGKWVGESAGGPYFGTSWALNPRYEVHVDAPGTLFAQLALPDGRFVPQPGQVEALGLHLLKSDYFPLRFDPDECVGKTAYVIADAVTFEMPVEKGSYWLVPSTYVSGQASPFVLRLFCTAALTAVQQPIAPYWQAKRLASQWELSGEYQHGDDNPQFRLVIPHAKAPTPQGGSFAVRLSMTMEVAKGRDSSVVLFLCASDGDGRLSGFIPDDQVVAKSKFLISDTVTLTTSLMPGEYTVVACLQPEGSASPCNMTFWCSRSEFRVREIPFWTKKTLTSRWVGSGVFQSADNQPQFELRLPESTKPIRLVMKALVTHCHDPAIILFVCDNSTARGRRLAGILEEDRIVERSTYVRAESVTLDWTVARPQGTYLIVPCLQPPGSNGTVHLSITSPSDGFDLVELLE
eukprot:EG_transcript_1977